MCTKTAYTLQYEGECKNKCSIKPCPRILAEICAKDAKGSTKTFNTPCELDNYNCQYPDESKSNSEKSKLFKIFWWELIVSYFRIH